MLSLGQMLQSNPPKRNRFYALSGIEEEEEYADVDNGNLLVLFFVNSLLDQGCTLSMFTPLLDNQFDLQPEILHKPFLVSYPIDQSIKDEGVCIEVYAIVESPYVVKLGVIKFKS